MKTVILGTLGVLLCSGQSLSFEVASVKKSGVVNMDREGRGKSHLETTPDSVTLRNFTLQSCVQWAYNVKEYQVTGPDWINNERYDIVAKAAHAASDADLRQMLQTLLAERFKLASHREARELPVYTLTVGADGIKMKQSEGDSESNFKPVKGMGKLSLAVDHTSMAQFADVLAQPMQRPVIDKTGLTGRYEFTLDLSKYFGMEMNQASLERETVETAVVFALRDQLGLRLEPKKAPVDIIVVDKAERIPTEN